MFLWRKRKTGPAKPQGAVLLAHGSSMASTPTFDLQVKSRPEYSLMDYLAERGYDVWCVDCEGYGRSTKTRRVSCGVERGARDLLAAANEIRRVSKASALHLYGISSGALRAALFAQKKPKAREAADSRRLRVDGRRKPHAQGEKQAIRRRGLHVEKTRRSAFIKSIFTRDHPGTAYRDVIDEYANAICALDDTIPNGTYIDMCERLPLVNPQKITASVMITRGQFDGIAHLDDLLEFFKLLPNPDKQFVMMPGIAHASLHEKNHRLVYYLIERFFSPACARIQGLRPGMRGILPTAHSLDSRGAMGLD